MFHVSQAGGSWLVWLLLLTLPLRGPHIPARPHLLDVDSPSPPGSVTRESSRSWCCDYCEPAARRLPFLIRKELKTQSSGLSWPLFLPLAVRTLRSGRRVLPLGLEWEGLARRGNLGGPQSQPPSSWAQRLGVRAEPVGPGWSVDLDRAHWLPEACGAPPHPAGLLLTPPLLGGAPPPNRAPPPLSAGLSPLARLLLPPPPSAELLLWGGVGGSSRLGSCPPSSSAAGPANQVLSPLALSTCFWFWMML